MRLAMIDRISISPIRTFIRSWMRMASMPLKEQIMEVINGPHVAAVATLDGKLPAVRFMVLARLT